MLCVGLEVLLNLCRIVKHLMGEPAILHGVTTPTQFLGNSVVQSHSILPGVVTPGIVGGTVPATHGRLRARGARPPRSERAPIGAMHVRGGDLSSTVTSAVDTVRQLANPIADFTSMRADLARGNVVRGLARGVAGGAKTVGVMGALVAPELAGEIGAASGAIAMGSNWLPQKI